MTESKERVRALMESGALSREDGRKLMDALERGIPSPKTGILALLVDPFERFGGPPAAIFGAVLAAFSAAISHFGHVRFDGILDIHAIKQRTSLLASALDQFAAFVLPAGVAWLVVRLAGRRTRIVDLLGVFGISRVPYAIAGVVVGFTPLSEGRLGPLEWLVVSIAIGAVGWSITLHYQGFRNASGLSGKRCTVAFVAFLLLSEIASKVFLAIAAR